MNPALVLLPLAAKPDPKDANPLWYWFAIFLFLAVAVVFLYLSLRKQLKKVDFPVEGDEPESTNGDEHPSQA